MSGANPLFAKENKRNQRRAVEEDGISLGTTLKLFMMYLIPLAFTGVYPFIIYSYYLEDRGGAIAAFWIGTLVLAITGAWFIYLLARQLTTPETFPLRLYAYGVVGTVLGTAVLTATRAEGC